MACFSVELQISSIIRAGPSIHYCVCTENMFYSQWSQKYKGGLFNTIVFVTISETKVLFAQTFEFIVLVVHKGEKVFDEMNFMMEREEEVVVQYTSL